MRATLRAKSVRDEQMVTDDLSLALRILVLSNENLENCNTVHQGRRQNFGRGEHSGKITKQRLCKKYLENLLKFFKNLRKI